MADTDAFNVEENPDSDSADSDFDIPEDPMDTEEVVEEPVEKKKKVASNITIPLSRVLCSRSTRERTFM